MNLKKIILSAALMGGVLSTAAFATTSNAHVAVAKSASSLQLPTVERVVTPTGLSHRLEGTTVTLSLTVDANGQPSAIKVISNTNRELTANVVAAVAKWQFTPAKRDGVPVSSNIVLPVHLVES